jgi:hypothetical protein
VIWAGAAELYDQWVFPGGCVQKNFLDVWLPAVGGTGNYPVVLDHPTKDSYWTNTSLSTDNRFDNVNVRAVIFSGWYDVFQAGSIETYELYDHNASAYSRDHQILIIGPWAHGVQNFTGVPQYATLDGGYTYMNQAEQFVFEDTLLGENVNWSAQPRVTYMLMGDPADPLADQWHTASDWPVPCTYQDWYFEPNGTLSVVSPTAATNMSYLYDPRNPLHTGGGRNYPPQAPNINVPITYGAVDNRPMDANRTDILQFTSANLTSAVTITGHLEANLRIASNCTDTDFTVKLLDIYPDGRQIYVADGILKARYRNGFTSAAEALMAPGNTYNLSIDMWNMAYRFSPGHRIEVVISSSNYPEYAVNPNTGGPVGSYAPSDMGTTVPFDVANNTLLLGQGATPSCIVMPIVP